MTEQWAAPAGEPLALVVPDKPKSSKRWWALAGAAVLAIGGGVGIVLATGHDSPTGSTGTWTGQTELELAAEDCGVEYGLDGKGGWNDSTDAAGDIIDSGWQCMVETVASTAVLENLLQATGQTGPVTLDYSGYTLSFFYNGLTEQASLSIYTAP